MDYRSLGMRIRKQRKNLHLTQEELAERAGISLSFLGHIERGTRKASLETLVSLANALGMSTDIMLQESLDDHVLSRCQGDRTQRKVLREISKLLLENPDIWEDQ